MRSRLNPKRYVPLSADPDFRYAVRTWERFSTETPPGSDTPTIMSELDSRDSYTRRRAESKLAIAVLRVLAAAVAWSMSVGYASAEDEIGRNMLPIINTTTRLLQMPTDPAPVAMSSESEARTGHGESLKVVKGQALREGVPPCWSPRWETDRHVLRHYSFAQLFAGEMLNHILDLIPVFEQNARTALKKIKKEQGKIESYTLARVLEKEALDAQPGLIAFFTRFDAAQSRVEEVSTKEKNEILALARGIKDQRNKAWGTLRGRMPPKTPKEQFDALQAAFGAEDVDKYL
jgi:hypothetical protein